MTSPIYQGSNEIVGMGDVDAVYSGSEQIWPSGPSETILYQVDDFTSAPSGWVLAALVSSCFFWLRNPGWLACSAQGSTSQTGGRIDLGDTDAIGQPHWMTFQLGTTNGPGSNTEVSVSRFSSTGGQYYKQQHGNNSGPTTIAFTPTAKDVYITFRSAGTAQANQFISWKNIKVWHES